MKDELLNLDSLTEEERDRIMSVLKRDEELRTAQDTRITDIKSEINTIRMNAVLKPGEDGNKMCRRCRDPFGYFFNTGEICPNCKFKVCKKCRDYSPKGTWMCILCFKQRQLKAMTGEWLLPSNQQNDSAQQLVKKSIHSKSSHSEEDGHDQVTVKRTSNAKFVESESSSDCSSVGEVSCPGDADKKRLSVLLAKNNIQESPSKSNNNNNNSQHVQQVQVSSKRFVESDSDDEEISLTALSNSDLNASRPTFSSNSALSTGRISCSSELSDQEDGIDYVDDGNRAIHTHHSDIPDFDEAGYKPHTELPNVFELIAKSKERSAHSPLSSMTSSPTPSTIGQRLVDLAASAENSDAEDDLQHFDEYEEFDEDSSEFDGNGALYINDGMGYHAAYNAYIKNGRLPTNAGENALMDDDHIYIEYHDVSDVSDVLSVISENTEPSDDVESDFESLYKRAEAEEVSLRGSSTLPSSDTDLDSVIDDMANKAIPYLNNQQRKDIVEYDSDADSGSTIVDVNSSPRHINEADDFFDDPEDKTLTEDSSVLFKTVELRRDEKSTEVSDDVIMVDTSQNIASFVDEMSFFCATTQSEDTYDESKADLTKSKNQIGTKISQTNEGPIDSKHIHVKVKRRKKQKTKSPTSPDHTEEIFDPTDNVTNTMDVDIVPECDQTDISNRSQDAHYPNEEREASVVMDIEGENNKAVNQNFSDLSLNCTMDVDSELEESTLAKEASVASSSISDETEFVSSVERGAPDNYHYCSEDQPDEKPLYLIHTDDSSKPPQIEMFEKSSGTLSEAYNSIADPGVAMEELQHSQGIAGDTETSEPLSELNSENEITAEDKIQDVQPENAEDDHESSANAVVENPSSFADEMEFFCAPVQIPPIHGNQDSSKELSDEEPFHPAQTKEDLPKTRQIEFKINNPHIEMPVNEDLKIVPKTATGINSSPRSERVERKRSKDEHTSSRDAKTRKIETSELAELSVEEEKLIQKLLSDLDVDMLGSLEEDLTDTTAKEQKIVGQNPALKTKASKNNSLEEQLNDLETDYVGKTADKSVTVNSLLKEEKIIIEDIAESSVKTGVPHLSLSENIMEASQAQNTFNSGGLVGSEEVADVERKNSNECDQKNCNDKPVSAAIDVFDNLKDVVDTTGDKVALSIDEIEANIADSEEPKKVDSGQLQNELQTDFIAEKIKKVDHKKHSTISLDSSEETKCEDDTNLCKTALNTDEEEVKQDVEILKIPGPENATALEVDDLTDEQKVTEDISVSLQWDTEIIEDAVEQKQKERIDLAKSTLTDSLPIALKSIEKQNEQSVDTEVDVQQETVEESVDHLHVSSENMSNFDNVKDQNTDKLKLTDLNVDAQETVRKDNILATNVNNLTKKSAKENIPETASVESPISKPRKAKKHQKVHFKDDVSVVKKLVSQSVNNQIDSVKMYNGSTEREQGVTATSTPIQVNDDGDGPRKPPRKIKKGAPQISDAFKHMHNLPVERNNFDSDQNVNKSSASLKVAEKEDAVRLEMRKKILGLESKMKANAQDTNSGKHILQDPNLTDESFCSKPNTGANLSFASANPRQISNSLQNGHSSTKQMDIAQPHEKRPPPLTIEPQSCSFKSSHSPNSLSTPALDALSDKYKSLTFEKNFYQLTYSNSPLYTPPPSSATSSVVSWGSTSSQKSCVADGTTYVSAQDSSFDTFDVSSLPLEDHSYYITPSLVASEHTDVDASSLPEDSGNITGTSQGSSPQQTHSKSPSDISVGLPSINISSVEGDEEEDSIDDISVRSRSSTFQQTFGGLFSSLGGSRESIASYYSQAGGYSYGVVEVKGAIQFAVDYKHKTGILEVQVKQASELAAVDKKKEKSDPYVKIYLLPDRTRNGKRKTHTKKNTLDPIFNETLRFHVSKSELSTRTLWLSVWNHDRFGKNVFLGEVTLPLNYHTYSSLPQWYTLQDKEEIDPSMMTYKGDLIVSMKYIPLENLKDEKSPEDKKKKKVEAKEGQLCVLIKEAKNLTAVRSNGYSDPFCKGYLLPEKGKHIKQKTTVVKRNLSPKWNYQFIFENISFEELPERCLELTIWDHDRFSSNDFLGGARLNLGLGQASKKDVDWMDARGEEIRIWESMIEKPNVWVDTTLTLRPNMDKQD